MSRKDRVDTVGFNPPIWGRRLSTWGVASVLYGLVRYTFVGEWLEHMFHDVVDDETEGSMSPIEFQSKKDSL